MFEDLRIEGEFTFTSGKKSKYYYDFDRLTPKEVTKYAAMLVDKYGWTKETFPFVATEAIGGIQLAFSIAHRLHLPLCIVDKEGHIRGGMPEQRGCLIVDDVVSSYAAVDRIISATGCEPEGVAAYIFRGVSKDPDMNLYYLDRKEAEV